MIINRHSDVELKIINLNNVSRSHVEKKAKKFMMKNVQNENDRMFIKAFELTLRKNMPRKNLIVFYNNIQNLKIRHKKYNEIKKEYVGYYTYNEIMINDYFYNTAFGHELFHMSSTILGKKYHSGFYQKNSINPFDSGIGIGLNEGYTEMLNRKYICSHSRGSYNSLVGICVELEKIIGRQIMERLYFSADLYGLIMELLKYENIDNTMKFISYLDYIYKSGYIVNIDAKLECYNFIQEYITKCLNSKIENDKELIKRKI